VRSVRLKTLGSRPRLSRLLVAREVHADAFALFTIVFLGVNVDQLLRGLGVKRNALAKADSLWPDYHSPTALTVLEVYSALPFRSEFPRRPECTPLSS
jgi:hypothetical protein